MKWNLQNQQSNPGTLQWLYTVLAVAIPVLIVLVALCHQVWQLEVFTSVFLCLLILLALLQIVIDRRRRMQAGGLKDANDRLESMNQQLTAGEQQLRAANQQLVATEQQLRATNQQLRASEDELRNAQQRYQMLFETMPSGVAVYEAIDDGNDFVFRDFNRAGERIEKVDRGLVLGKRVSVVFPGVATSGILDMFRQVWRTGEPTFLPMAYQDEHRAMSWRDNYICKLPNGNIVSIYNDVSETKRAQIERDRFFNCSRDMLCIAGFDGYFKQINPSWQRILGWSNDELLSKPWIEFVHPDDRMATQQTRVSLIDGKEVLLFENRYQCKDGSWKWISWNSYSLPNEQLIFSVARDITEQKEAQEHIRRSEERFKSVIAAMPVGIHMYTLNEKDELIFTGANAMADKILNLDNSQFIGKAIVEAFPSHALSEVPARYAAAARDGTPWDTEQIAYQDERVAGAFEVHAFRIGNRSMGAMFHDITNRKKSEEALKASEQRFRSFFEHAPMPYQSLDVQGCLVDVNSVWLEILGYKREEALGMWFGELLNAEQKELFKVRFEDFKKNGAVDNTEFSLRMKNGAFVNTVFFGRVGYDDVGAFKQTHCVFFDMTEKKRLWDELQRTQRLDSIGMLAGGIAHDFNNLLGGIFGYIDMARDLCQGKDSQVSEYLDRAMGAFLRAKDLTQQLLTFAKGGKPVRKSCLIAPLVRNAAELAVSGSNIRCSIINALPDAVVEVDEGQISQVVSNLVLNARQAMPDGGVVRIDLVVAPIEDNVYGSLTSGEYVVISVHDSGIGIQPEYLDKIFDPFFTTKQQGSGLGLATSYSIMKKHDGHISVTSVVGKGSSFALYLPFSRAELAQNKSIDSKVLADGSGRILIMDDESMIRDLARQMLVRAGYQVDAVSNGTDAIAAYSSALAQGNPYVLLILDLTIPDGMGGLETITRLKKIDPAVRAIVSSGYSDEPVIAEALQAGFVGVVTKPYRTQELVSCVNATIRGDLDR